MILTVAALAVFYCLLVLAVPMHPCFRCKGKRVVPRGKRGRKRCPWCKGRGLQPWPGGRAVHRFFWSVAGRRLMERRREHLKEK
jgi:hypothetical protein